MSRPLVIYDGDCRLCRAGARVLTRWDRAGRLAIAPFGDPRAEEALAVLPPERRYATAHLVRDGLLRSGRHAARETFRMLPGGRLVTALGLHRLYGPVARNRRHLGPRVPDVPVTRRP